MEKAQNYVWGGDTAQNVSQKGGTLHILSELIRDNWGGHHTSKFDHMFILGWGHRTKLQTLAVGRVGGWSGFAKNNATPGLQKRVELPNTRYSNLEPS